MRKILVTGAGGFIGSHLTERLAELGYQVRAFVRYTSTNSWGWLDCSPFRDALDIVTGDVRDYDAVSNAVRGVDTVFHLAALIGIPYSYISPLAYVRTNVEGTYNVLEASRRLSVEQVLVTSTSETYGTAQYVPMDEKHPQVAQSPYSATKIAADQLTLSYHRSFGLPVKVVRPFNTYGPRQSARAVIPTIVTQVLAGVRTLKLGNTAPTRDLTYVLDTVNGFIAIAEAEGLLGEVTNIGMNSEISVGALAALIGRLMQVDLEVIPEDQRVRPDASEVKCLHCDNTKILSQTRWQPAYVLAGGLTETVAWITEHQARFKADLYNV
jgi:NAD dependent epimerase/dehydratase